MSKGTNATVAGLKEAEYHQAARGTWGSSDISDDDTRQPAQQKQQPGMAKRRQQQQQQHDTKQAPMQKSLQQQQGGAEQGQQRYSTKPSTLTSKTVIPPLRLDVMEKEEGVPALTASDSPVVSQRAAGRSSRGGVSLGCV